jgi:hypothetical protein
MGHLARPQYLQDLLMTIATHIAPRTVEALVGPPGGAGIRFTQEYMTGSVKTHKGGKPNECTHTIHNLSEATIAQLEAPNMELQVKAGSTFVGQLFLGTVTTRGVVTKNDIPNRTTTITAKDGRRIYRDTKVARAYPPGATIESVVLDLLALTGLPVGSGSVFPPGTFPGGWAHQGLWRQAMAEVLLPYGFYWTIQGGVIYTLNAASTAPGNVPLVSPATGMIGSPARTKKGCNVASVLNSAIIAGRGIQVTSQFFNGLYRNAVVDHKYDTDGLIWRTDAQTEVIK